MSELSSNHGETREVKELALDIEKLAGVDPELANDRLRKIEHFSNGNDRFAHYVLASYYIFGRYPQSYDFHTAYTADELKAYTQRDTLKGFGHYIQAISAPDNTFQDFQIQALYEMYMTISGSSALFKNFDIDDRPEPNQQHPLSNLFEKKDTLLMMLLELGHTEIYLDVANHFMDQGEKPEKIFEALNLAVEHSVGWELRRAALFKLGEIYYYGKLGVSADVEQAKSFWSRIDDDRALARVANNYLKADKFEEAKVVLLSLKNPDSVVDLFSGYPDIVELISNRESFTGLLDQAFGFQLQFPQVEGTIDVRRFHSKLTLEQILAEDDAEQDDSTSEDTSSQTKHGEADDIHEKLNSDTPNDETQESHVVENPVKEKEISTEVLSAIGSNQDSIAEEFDIITEDSDPDNMLTNQDDQDPYDDEDPFGEPVEQVGEDDFPDFD